MHIFKDSDNLMHTLLIGYHLFCSIITTNENSANLMIIFHGFNTRQRKLIVDLKMKKNTPTIAFF